MRRNAINENRQRRGGEMSEWIYEYVFITKIFRIAKLKSKFKNKKKEYGVPYLIYEYKVKGIWNQRTLIR